ncbi:MAG: hypothetical protein ACI837_003473 [Crocinitomicaceae bacterium]|jgi:hypothetical protein
MKKMLMIAVMSISMTTVFASNELPKLEVNQINEICQIAQNASNGVAIGRAMAAIRTSCPNAQGDLSYSVTTGGTCAGDATMTKVTFWKVPNCPPNQVCIQAIISIGSVKLGCNNEVLSVNCGIISL